MNDGRYLTLKIGLVLGQKHHKVLTIIITDSVLPKYTSSASTYELSGAGLIHWYVRSDTRLLYQSQKPLLGLSTTILASRKDPVALSIGKFSSSSQLMLKLIRHTWTVRSDGSKRNKYKYNFECTNDLASRSVRYVCLPTGRDRFYHWVGLQIVMNNFAYATFSVRP